MGALARAHGGSSMCEAASRVCERARVRVRELGLGLGLSLSDLNNDARLTTDVPTVMGWVRAWFGWFGRYRTGFEKFSAACKVPLNVGWGGLSRRIK